MSHEVYEISITVDTNDGDYLTRTSIITHADLEQIKPLIEAVKDYDGEDCNFPYGEYADGDVYTMYSDFSEEEIEKLLEYCPYGEYGFHTLESVEYYDVPIKTKLL